MSRTLPSGARVITLADHLRGPSRAAARPPVYVPPPEEPPPLDMTRLGLGSAFIPPPPRHPGRRVGVGLVIALTGSGACWAGLGYILAKVLA